jgi:hypothetical protein
VAAQHATIAGRVFTPGSQAGEPLSVLSSLKRRSRLWDHDVEIAREALSASVSLLLRLMDVISVAHLDDERSLLLGVLLEQAGASVSLGPHPAWHKSFAHCSSSMKCMASYRALSNAGLWCVGRLATNADREQVVEEPGRSIVERSAQTLGAAWFLLRNFTNHKHCGSCNPGRRCVGCADP